ncbi:MAG: CBS domain-containing protein [Oligoflexia bacterium]|nr:CBS domain-containing protein [Oligoflexia bacterium]
MNVREIMSSGVEVIGPDATLKEAARKMDEANVGILPVCGQDRLVGIISDRDIVIRSVSAGQDPNEVKVQDAMTSPVIYCFEDQSVSDIARKMRDQDIRRLPVLNRAKRMVGIISMDDILQSGGSVNTTPRAA